MSGENSIELLQRRPRKPDPTSFFNLSDYAKSRILYDMLDKVKPKESPDYVILVLDDHAAKLISTFCSMFDLMEHGNVYQVEKLNMKRKRYPMSDCIYLVQPTNASIERIVNDFLEEDELDYD